ncbi:MAG: ATP-binding protein [Candidatus Cloacimonadota bacterium]|nr:ATP-binding protein [Candidatus Cloacimonadota bacterium]
MLKDILYQFNPWWEETFKSTLIDRPLHIQQLSATLSSKSIEMLTGLRRVGKTALMKLLIQQLLTDIDANQILYISLDAFGLEKYSIHEILEEYRKIHKHKRDVFLYLFFDEVIAKPSYQQELKNFYDNENVKVFASASQAGSLKDQRANLTGRVRLHEILPLKFDEFLQFKKIKIMKSESYLKEQYFEEYMTTGGMPEFVLTGDIGYLQELCDNIIYKDIIAANRIKDATIIRDYFKLLMERAGKQTSITKMANILGISPDSSRRYFGYFQNSYIIHPIERCGKLNERIRSGKKIYAGDLGMRNMVTGFRDKGALFENLVYFELKKYSPCYFLHNGIEIDFKTENLLIEVKYNSELTEKQKKLFKQTSSKNKMIIDSVDSFLNLEHQKWI